MASAHVRHDARAQIKRIALTHDRPPDHGESPMTLPVNPARFHLQARCSSTTAGLCTLFCLWWRRCGAMSSRSKAEDWAQELEAVAGRIAPQFGRAEARRPALTYLQGPLAPFEREKSWDRAEGSGGCFPPGMHEVPCRG